MNAAAAAGSHTASPSRVGFVLDVGSTDDPAVVQTALPQYVDRQWLMKPTVHRSLILGIDAIT